MAALLPAVTPMIIVATVLAAADVAELPTDTGWVNVVDRLGFPIAMAFALLWIIHRTLPQMADKMAEATRANTDATNAQAKATLELRGTIERLLDRLPRPQP